MTLPYSNYFNIVNTSFETSHLTTKLNSLERMVNSVSPVLIEKVKDSELATDDNTINVKFLKTKATKLYDIKTLTLSQASFQFITYGR